MTATHSWRRAGIAAAATLGLIGLSTVPALAAAPGDDIATDTVYWGELTSSGLLEGSMWSIDPLTGLDGWTGGGWDDLVSLEIDFGIVDGTLDFEPTVPPTGDIYGDGLVFTQTFPNSTVVTLTLRVAGSYAQWTYSIDGAYEAALARANVQYDDDTAWAGAVDGVSGGVDEAWTVAYDEVQYDSSILAHHVTTDADEGTVYIGGEDDDQLRVNVIGATTMTFTVAMLDYGPCGGSDAFDFAEEIAPTLDETFGESYGTFAGDCPLLVEPLTFTQGVPVDGTVLEYTLSMDVFNYWFTGFDDEDELVIVVEGLPEGVTYTVQWDNTPRIVLQGTPTVSGVFPVVLGFAAYYAEGDWTGEAVSATADITVTSSAQDEEEPAATGSDRAPVALAVTGSDGAPVALAALGLMAAGALVLTGRRLARR